jgi:hypothetical protein
MLHIDRLVYLTNAVDAPRRFVYAPETLNRWLGEPGFVGLFHTHRYRPWFGLRDWQAARRLARRLQRPLVLGIRRREHLRCWLFEPHRLLPLRLEITES